MPMQTSCKQAAQKKSYSEIVNLRRSNGNQQSACGGQAAKLFDKIWIVQTKLLEPYVFPISLFTSNRILDEIICKYWVK